MPVPSSGTLYLVDAHSLIFQVFHAIRDMTSPSGMPVNALFGFVRDMLYLRSLEPTYLICAFDRTELTFRSDLYPPYKANRPPMPDDIQLQLPMIHQALEALAIPVLSAERFEADDILATVAKEAEKRELDVFICTSDKDCRQLISDRVRLYNLRKREEFGKAELLADWGVKPEQVVDLQALVGDSVDNVPGVDGIGVKTAAKLLQEFHTLDGILASIDKISGAKRKENLRKAGPVIAISKPLVQLDQNVPLDFDWEGWVLRAFDPDRMLALCREWGFQSLASQIRAQAGKSTRAAPVQVEMFAATDDLFPFGANVGQAVQAAPAAPQVQKPPSVPQVWQATYRLIDEPAAFDDLLTRLRQQSRFAIDLETTSLDPQSASIVGIALSWTPGEAYYVALRGPAGSRLVPEEHVLTALRPILADARIAKVNQNIKYDLLVLRANGVILNGIVGDPMVADYLLHAGERSHNLEDLSRRYLDHQVIPITDLIGVKSKKTPQLRMDQVPTEKVATYAGEDADVALRLAAMLEKHLDSTTQGAALRPLYDELEVPLIEVLAEMEFNGVRVDVAMLAKLSTEMGTQLRSIEEEIYHLAGHSFNIGSLPQLRKVLFEELKLPVQGKTNVTGEPSTDQESLEKLAALNHPAAGLPRKILEHRQITKLKGTYVDALPEVVHPRTGRVHTSFNQTVAATGRLSTSEPNLQNIPVRREMGQQVRQAFLPAEGWQLLTADYSQIELRLLAHFCQDERMLQAFAQERDVHASVAAEIFGVPEEQVTSAQRRMAKTVNFGVIYGISASGLSQRLQITKEQATDFIASYFKRYPKVEGYQAELLRLCRQRSYVATILGRRRRFDPQAIRATSTPQTRNQAEREAINMEVQGSAADLIKLAMLHVHRAMRQQKLQARLLLQVHDELVFEAPPAEMPQLCELVRREMTVPVAQRLQLRVPLRVDMAVGGNWLDVDAIAEPQP